MNKYLITKEQKDNTILEWSDTIVKNSGWKFIDNMTPPKVNYEASKLEEYRNSVKEIIKNKFKELFINNTQKLFQKKNDDHDKVIETKTGVINAMIIKHLSMLGIVATLMAVHVVPTRMHANTIV